MASRGPFARLRIDKHHHTEGAVAVEGVLGVRPHDDASTLTPLPVLAADGDASSDRDDDLDGMMRRGQRVLVVLRSGDWRVARRLRRLCRAAKSQLTTMTLAEVVCVDGVDGVEAVVIRYARTGGLCAVNASAFLSCEGSNR